MADGTENQTPYNTDAIIGDIRRTEAERVRMAEVAAHERGVVRDLDPREEAAQIRHENALMKNEMAVMMSHENAMIKNEMAVMLANMRALTEAADRRGPAHGQAPPEAAQGVQMAQNTQAADRRGPAHGQAPPEAAQGVQMAQGAGGMGPAHGQAPPEADQGVQRSQSSQVLSFTRTSTDLVGSMADETAKSQSSQALSFTRTSADLVSSMADEIDSKLYPNTQKRTWTETEMKQAWIGWAGSMADETSSDCVGCMADETERSAAQGAGRIRARGDRLQYQDSQRKKAGCLSLPRFATRRSGHWSQICDPLLWKSVIRDHAVKEEKKEIESNNVATSNVIRDQEAKREKKEIESNNAATSMAGVSERELAKAQGAGGMGPAHGQAPPEAAQGDQAFKEEQRAGGMGPAHGQAPPEAAQGVQRSQSSQVLSFTRTSADLFGSTTDETAELAYLVGSIVPMTRRTCSLVGRLGLSVFNIMLNYRPS
jgi:hypothetical protein